MVSEDKRAHAYSIRATTGRPPVYDSPLEMALAVDAYFNEWCPGEFKYEEVLRKGKPTGDKKKVWLRPPETPTITGLALYLGFADKQSLWDYSNKNYGKEEFSFVVNRARMRVEQGHEMNLQNNACTGSIFFLKNHGWGDERTVKHEGIPEVKEPVINIYSGGAPLADNENSVNGERF